MTDVTVVIPAYNEGVALAARLAEVTEAFAIYRSSGYIFRYLIVDDGSIDETYEAASAFAATRTNVEVVRHEQNRGLGAALRTAFARVDRGYAMVLDADLSYAPATGMELLEALERADADVASASPYMRGGSVKNVPIFRRIMSREANRILSLAVGGKLATLTCMVRVYRADVLERLAFRSDGMEAIAEILLSALRGGMAVIEVPAMLHWSPQRRADTGRIRPLRLAKQIGATLRLAFEHRPSLWLAVPGLFPGLLPIVLFVLLIMHASTPVAATVTAATLFVQYASLAIFAGQIGFFLKRSSIRATHPSTRMML